MAKGDAEWKRNHDFFTEQANNPKEHPEVRQDAAEILADMENDD